MLGPAAANSNVVKPFSEAKQPRKAYSPMLSESSPGDGGVLLGVGWLVDWLVMVWLTVEDGCVDWGCVGEVCPDEEEVSPDETDEADTDEDWDDKVCVDVACDDNVCADDDPEVRDRVVEPCPDVVSEGEDVGG
jgi:hypothetical protein